VSNSILFDTYLNEIQKNLNTRVSTEHTHRPALKTLIESIGVGLHVVNEPKKIECGSPDYIITRANVPVGYIEAKDVGTDLKREERSEQLKRYFHPLHNLILTDYIEFRWYVEGELKGKAQIASVSHDGKVKKNKEGIDALNDLLQGFFAQDIPVIGRPQELARRMASLARLICNIIEETFKRESEEGALHAQFKAFHETLIPDLKTDQFADMYAQTIAYGLFAARLRIPENQEFTRQSAAWNLPKTNPFLRKLFNEIAGPDLDDRIAWIVDNLVYLLARSDMTEILRDFGKKTKQEDPIVHFYETFLSEYNPRERMKRGVYYTPEPVVSYIVRSIDHILKTRFNLPMGLADQNTIILDPAVGTGTFLYFVINLIHETLTEMGQTGAWNDYVKNHLLKRIFGFELLMAPYAIAHLNLGFLLQETGYDFSGDQRLGIYLTNSLEEGITKTTSLGFSEFIVEEANSAGEIKQDKPVMVVLGNPPYSVSSVNKGKHIENLMDLYKKAVRDERNIQPLSDDYIKFLRFAHDRIERTGYGVIGMITNNSYLSGLIHRGMREELLKTFDEIYILNLHGSSKIMETTLDGSPDENVFDIRQGVAISLFVKLMEKKQQTIIKYADLQGLREHKYINLLENDINTLEWIEIKPEDSQNFFFMPKNLDLKEEYYKGWSISSIFMIFSSGIKTHRDHFAVDFCREQLKSRILAFKDKSTPDDVIGINFELKNTRDWDLSKARLSMQLSKDWEKDFFPYLYRPFDVRIIYYSFNIIELPRFEVMQHMLSSNIALISVREVDPNATYSHFNISKWLTDIHTSDHFAGNLYVFPLYLYNDQSKGSHDLFDKAKQTRKPNISPDFISFVKGKLNLDFIPDGKGDLKSNFGPEDILHYAYAVFHSPTYREKYEEFLKIDFPRLPITSDREQFKSLADKGEELVALHLMESPLLNHFITKFPISDSNEIEKVMYVEPHTEENKLISGRVYINKTQYFEGIEPEIWAFRVGGYQVLYKWLNDRKGRKLSDLFHYQKIVIALKETSRLMKEIDDLIPKWPIE